MRYTLPDLLLIRSQLRAAGCKCNLVTLLRHPLLQHLSWHYHFCNHRVPLCFWSNPPDCQARMAMALTCRTSRKPEPASLRAAVMSRRRLVCRYWRSICSSVTAAPSPLADGGSGYGYASLDTYASLAALALSRRRPQSETAHRAPSRGALSRVGRLRSRWADGALRRVHASLCRPRGAAGTRLPNAAGCDRDPRSLQAAAGTRLPALRGDGGGCWTSTARTAGDGGGCWTSAWVPWTSRACSGFTVAVPLTVTSIVTPLVTPPVTPPVTLTVTLTVTPTVTLTGRQAWTSRPCSDLNADPPAELIENIRQRLLKSAANAARHQRLRGRSSTRGEPGTMECRGYGPCEVPGVGSRQRVQDMQYNASACALATPQLVLRRLCSRVDIDERLYLAARSAFDAKGGAGSNRTPAAALGHVVIPCDCAPK